MKEWEKDAEMSCGSQCDGDYACYESCLEASAWLHDIQSGMTVGQANTAEAERKAEHLHDCNKEYRADCASCNGVSPMDVGTW